MDLLKILTEEYKEHDTKIESDEGCDFFIIVNPYWNENIRISLNDDMIFYFSYHHGHCDYSIEYLIDYINNFLCGNWVAIEFFHENTDLFGGARRLEDIDISSGDSLLKSFTGDNASLHEHLLKQIKSLNCRCLIRGWNNEYSRDIDFVI